MKKLLLVITMVLVSLVQAADWEEVNRYYRQLKRLDKDQLEIMLYSYKVGATHDLGYALAAIAWKESNYGKYLMNIFDGNLGSYGVYHILLETAISRNKIKTNWDKSRYAEKLVFDIELCADEAISELLYWKSYFKRSATPWKAMFAGYNAGYKGLRSTAGKAYADDAVLRVKALQKYFKEHKLEERLMGKKRN